MSFRNRIHKTFITIFVAALSSAVCAEIELVTPESVGLSTERLARIAPAMQAMIDEGRTAGIVTLVARHGRVAHLEAFGYADREEGIELTTDHMFRLYSMTKPVTSVALLMLYEEGEFQLNDPLARHIPELGDVQVFAGVDGTGQMILEAPRRAPTVRDVFRHTAGFGYGFGQSLVDRAYQTAGANYGAAGSLEEMVAVNLPTIPLLYHPGDRWVYSVSHDVQAYLVERLSGMPYERFVRTRIFGPLGMSDATFGVPAEYVSRFTANYGPAEGGGLERIENRDGRAPRGQEGGLGEYGRHTDIAFGGSSMSSTVEDYLRFAQMLVNGGELDGVRILGEKTVELMRSNHLPDDIPGIGLGGGGTGYGLGVSVRLDAPAARTNLGSAGQFGWAGAAGTWVTMDPAEDMVLLFMTQNVGGGGLSAEFQTLAYQAIVGD